MEEVQFSQYTSIAAQGDSDRVAVNPKLALAAFFNITGTPSASFHVSFAALSNFSNAAAFAFVKNNTAQSAILISEDTSGTGTAVTILAGQSAFVQSDGINVFPVPGLQVGSGITPIVDGGTGLSAPLTANYVLGSNAAGNAYEGKHLIAGANVTITYGVGTVTIAATDAAAIPLIDATAAVTVTAGVGLGSGGGIDGWAGGSGAGQIQFHTGTTCPVDSPVMTVAFAVPIPMGTLGLGPVVLFQPGSTSSSTNPVVTSNLIAVEKDDGTNYTGFFIYSTTAVPDSQTNWSLAYHVIFR